MRNMQTIITRVRTGLPITQEEAGAALAHLEKEKKSFDKIIIFEFVLLLAAAVLFAIGVRNLFC